MFPLPQIIRVLALSTFFGLTANDLGEGAGGGVAEPGMLCEATQ